MTRVDYRRVFPEAIRAMGGLEQAVRESSVEPATRDRRRAASLVAERLIMAVGGASRQHIGEI